MDEKRKKKGIKLMTHIDIVVFFFFFWYYTLTFIRMSNDKEFIQQHLVNIIRSTRENID